MCKKENFFRKDNFDAIVDMVMKSTRASFALENIHVSDENFRKMKEFIKDQKEDT